MPAKLLKDEITLLTREVKDLAKTLEKKMNKLERLVLKQEKLSKIEKAKSQKSLPKIFKKQSRKVKIKIKRMLTREPK